MTVSPFYTIPHADNMAKIAEERKYQQLIEAAVESLKKQGTFTPRDGTLEQFRRLHAEHGDILRAAGYVIYRSGHIGRLAERDNNWNMPTLDDSEEYANACEENIDLRFAEQPIHTNEDHLLHIHLHTRLLENLRPDMRKAVGEQFEKHIQDHQERCSHFNNPCPDN